MTKRAQSALAPGRTARRSRRWFRGLALLSPLLILTLLELALRAIGFGYPTGFFLATRQNGRDVLIENQSFTRRYFPPGLERTPQTITMPAIKPPDTTRVFVFGESAVMGDPEPAYGFPRVLETMLRHARPTQRTEVVNVALTAINSHVARDIAHDCAAHHGDYWIIYLGNNEVVGPFGAGTVFGAANSSLTIIRAQLALKRTRVGQALDGLRWKLAPPAAAPTSWQGMEMFLTQQVPAGDPRLQNVYAHFAQNLREIIQCGQRAGARVVVGTIAVNLKDCAPFASVHRAGLDAKQESEWQRLIDSGRTALTTTNAGAALPLLTRAAEIDEQHAGGRFLLAQAQWISGQTNAARQSFAQALELDALRFRADATINNIIRTTARETGAELIDVASHLGQRSTDGLGLPGREFFYEHVHFNFAGNYAIARLFAENIRGGSAVASWPTIDECAAALAFTDFDHYRVLDEVRQRLEKPPYSFQLDHAAQMTHLQEQLSALRSGQFAAAKAMYETAIAAQPEDPVLRENFGTLLKDFGQLNEARPQWQRFVALRPHSADACLGLADTLDALGHSAEAIIWFRRALLLRPNGVETRNGLALALAATGNSDAAIREYQKALRYRPSFTEARVNLGNLLASLGRTTEAMDQLREAVRRETNSAPAQLNLGQALADAGRWQDAIACFQEAIRIKPADAETHFQLGVALAKSGRKAEAAKCFQETLRLQPNHPGAKRLLAQ